MRGFKNVFVYKDNKEIVKTSIQFQDGIISSFDYDNSLDELPDNLIIVPGFIDEHIHGANGSDVMEGTRTAIKNISKSITQDGVTSFLPTTMSMSLDAIKKALKNIAREAKNVEGAQILGIHLEGPFISKKMCGAQDANNIIVGNTKILDDLIETSNSLIKIVTLDYNSNADLIEPLRNKGILVSLGHSDCNASNAIKAFEKGATSLTHTFNAMNQIHHRDIGLLGEGLINNDIYCELIADLHHVSQDAIKLLYACKGNDKIILISDSMEARFLKNGEYSLGGQKVFVQDGIATLKNGTLAGSVLKTNIAIRNIKDTLQIPLSSAIDMASKNVAAHLQLKNKGCISIGKDADLVVIDENLNVYMTIVNGQIVYKKEIF